MAFPLQQSSLPDSDGWARLCSWGSEWTSESRKERSKHAPTGKKTQKKRASEPLRAEFVSVCLPHLFIIQKTRKWGGRRKTKIEKRKTTQTKEKTQKDWFGSRKGERREFLLLSSREVNGFTGPRDLHCEKSVRGYTILCYRRVLLSQRSLLLSSSSITFFHFFLSSALVRRRAVTG